MKSIKRGFIFSFLPIIFFCWTSSVHAQEKDKATLQQMVQSKHFVFKAQTMIPQGGATKQLTGEYDVRVSGDSLVTYLPYIGRAYGPVMPGEGGINFTSTKYEYKAKPTKKGGWDIILKPQDAKDVRELQFTVYDNGTAYLHVLSNNKQNISFNGYIDQKK